MKFDYDLYKSELFITPIKGIVLVCACIAFYPYLFIKIIKNDTVILVYGCVIFFIFILYVLLDVLGKFKYGIKLKNETINDALSITGTIDKISTIKTPFPHMYKIAPLNDVKAQIITISNSKYYIMQKGELKIGDYVYVNYLPKSTIVLEVNIIDDANVQNKSFN